MESKNIMLKFEWTDKKVAEVAKIITEEYNKSEVWSGDYTAEMNIIKNYKKEIMLDKYLKYIGAGGIHQQNGYVNVKLENVKKVLEDIMSRVHD